MSPEVDRFIPVAALLIAILIGFTADLAFGTQELWKVAAPIGFIAGLGARLIMRGKFRAR